MHEHNFVGVPGGRMYVRCDRGHQHDVMDASGFEVCHCGESRNEPPPYPCPDVKYVLRLTLTKPLNNVQQSRGDETPLEVTQRLDWVEDLPVSYFKADASEVIDQMVSWIEVGGR